MTSPFVCADPASFGFDLKRLERIGPFLQERYLDSSRLPMTQVLVARHGQPVYYDARGRMGEGRDALRDDAIFRIASMSKPVTSIAFMQLVEQCKVALEEPVTKVLPEFKNLRVYGGGGGSIPFALPRRRCVSSTC
jgi:CubicO group peptidase (beta-lactamase class C family)